MNRIYLCGQVTGRPVQEAADHFEKNKKRICAGALGANLSLRVLNPKEIIAFDAEWHKAMKISIRELTKCNGIALLQGWKFSKGAKLELLLAKYLRIPVVYIEPPAGPMDLTEVFICAPETLRYFNARLKQFYDEGVEESLAEERAAAELANRYLDPYGFEYIEINEGE